MRVRSRRGADPKADPRGAGRRGRRIFAQRARWRARERQELGFEVVIERTYPLSTTEFSPVVRAIQAANPDFVFAATLPIDTVGIIRSASEIGFKPKMIGGAMLGLSGHRLKQQLGPLINGYISNEFYIPAPSLQFAGTKEMMAEYQKRAVRRRPIRSASPIRPTPTRRDRFLRGP